MIDQRISRHGQFHVDEIPSMLSAILEDSEWTSLIDSGCGDGSLLHALNERGLLERRAIYAVDVSRERLEIVHRINESLNCVIGSACNAPLADKSIDIFVSTQVIEHVPDDRAMVREMHRILSDNGIAYLSTVFKKPYGWYFYRNNGRWVLDPTHLREYTKDEELLDILDGEGFEVLENQKTLDGRPLMDAVLRRLGAGRSLYDNRFFRVLRRLRVPIPGYFNWEIACVKA